MRQSDATPLLGAAQHKLKRIPTSPYSPEEQVLAFWAKVDKGGVNGCWLWTGSRKPRNFYGHLAIGRKNKMAHRYSWELAHGPIPAGMHVLHRCDVPWCVNPAHLWLGTHDDNMRDMKEKGRRTWGEKNKCNKLTLEQAKEVLREYKKFAPRRSNRRELAVKYGVRPNTISALVNGISWPHLPRGA